MVQSGRDVDAVRALKVTGDGFPQGRDAGHGGVAGKALVDSLFRCVADMGGVGKFGSPIARLVTSTPCDLSSRALALMVRVAEGFMWAILSENCMGLYLGGLHDFVVMQ